MAHPQVGSILQALMSITANLFREYPRIINDMHSAYVQKLDEIHKQLEKSEKECMDLLAATEQLERTAIRQAAKIKQHQERNYSNFKVPGSTVHKCMFLPIIILVKYNSSRYSRFYWFFRTKATSQSK